METPIFIIKRCWILVINFMWIRILVEYTRKQKRGKQMAIKYWKYWKPALVGCFFKLRLFLVGNGKTLLERIFSKQCKGHWFYSSAIFLHKNFVSVLWRGVGVSQIVGLISSLPKLTIHFFSFTRYNIHGMSLNNYLVCYLSISLEQRHLSESTFPMYTSSNWVSLFLET